MLSIGDEFTKLGFTGTRHGMWPDQKKTFIKVLDSKDWKEFHHGDCVGCDSKAHDMFLERVPCAIVHIHPPRSETQRAHCELRPMLRFEQSVVVHEPATYDARNRAIVLASEILVAIPQERQMTLRSGTWQTVRMARSLHKPCLVINPNGSITMENFNT